MNHVSIYLTIVNQTLTSLCKSVFYYLRPNKMLQNGLLFEQTNGGPFLQDS